MFLEFVVVVGVLGGLYAVSNIVDQLKSLREDIRAIRAELTQLASDTHDLVKDRR